MAKKDETAAAGCPVNDCLDTATKAAKGELGTDATNKRVKVTSALTVAVTENDQVDTTACDATVELGVKTSRQPVAEAK